MRGHCTRRIGLCATRTASPTMHADTTLSSHWATWWHALRVYVYPYTTQHHQVSHSNQPTAARLTPQSAAAGGISLSSSTAPRQQQQQQQNHCQQQQQLKRCMLSVSSAAGPLHSYPATTSSNRWGCSPEPCDQHQQRLSAWCHTQLLHRCKAM
jgi:hypothetical protein